MHTWSQELQHTSATLAAMETSDSTLRAANKEYGDQRGTIKQSHQLLRTMKVNSLKDSLKLYAALAFFTLVIGYVGLRRATYFVPPAVINSLPTLATFGIGQHKGNASSDLPHMGSDQQYHVPGTGMTGRETGGSTAGTSSAESSFAQVCSQIDTVKSFMCRDALIDAGKILEVCPEKVNQFWPMRSWSSIRSAGRDVT